MNSNQDSVGYGPSSLGANGDVAGEKFSRSSSGDENCMEETDDSVGDAVGSEMVVSGVADTNLPFSSQSRSLRLLLGAVFSVCSRVSTR
ncbi:hypothetical protein VKT23_012659 [Stygiomarasmius scandens]|uniref:Uncharacterized protein n=1 Tax=Marasmiellus scandens TaxID=2682957 RepID=A0ABR1J6G5_9AGAR